VGLTFPRPTVRGRRGGTVVRRAPRAPRPVTLGARAALTYLNDRFAAYNRTIRASIDHQALLEYQKSSLGVNTLARRYGGDVRRAVEAGERGAAFWVGAAENHKGLERLFRTAPEIEKAIRVQRGMSHGSRLVGLPRGDREAIAAALRGLTGNVLEDVGFISTSLSRAAAKEFIATAADDVAVRFDIVVPQGTRVLWMRLLGLPGYKKEQEVLLAAGTRFRIRSVTIKKGIRPMATISLEVLPP
jgi:hypothetical protein